MGDILDEIIIAWLPSMFTVALIKIMRGKNAY